MQTYNYIKYKWSKHTNKRDCENGSNNILKAGIFTRN